MSTKLSKARADLIKLSPDYKELINKLDLKAINTILSLTKETKNKVIEQ